MPDLGSQDELLLRRMRDGGYLVMSRMFAGDAAQMLYASSEIDSALDYIRGQVMPISASRPAYDDKI